MISGVFVRKIFALALSLSSVAQAASTQDLAVSKVRLPAGGATITAELFEARTAEAKPVVLVLHGAGGTLFDGPEMRRVARHLAAAGSAVYLVQYFERTGTVVALDATMQKNFETWQQTVRETIAAVQTLRGSREPIGIYGYSLGAFLALAAASENPRVGAIVEHAGGAWNGKMERLGKLPPVLMVHGERDARVPFDKYAKPLVPVLRKRAAKLETRFFADEGHGFSPAAMSEVREAAAQFFRRSLRAKKS